MEESIVAYLAKQWGLNALLVHLAVKNIVKYTGYDLYTLVINWEADVIDLELLSDHATVYKLTREYGIFSVVKTLRQRLLCQEVGTGESQMLLI